MDLTSIKDPSKVVATVMIVDDDEIFLEELGELLTEIGYATVTVKDPLEAASTAQRVKPEVVIMDMKMPNRNGLDVAQDIQNILGRRDLPIIAVSGFLDHGFNPLSNWRGIKKFIRKPFNPFYVIRAVEEALRESAMKPEGVNFSQVPM